MKKVFLVLAITAFLCLPVFAFAEAITVEGTVQGLSMTLKGKTCPIGKEHICAAAESYFVLAAKDGNFYFLPKFTSAQMARYINIEIMVEGEKIQKGSLLGLDVTSAKVKKDGKWVIVYDRWIQEEIDKEKYGGR